MKKYHAFAGSRQFPSGGLDDYIDSFETIEEAKERIRQFLKELDEPYTYWSNIAKTQEDGSLDTVYYDR